jgi:hypothetical protein
MSLNDVDLENIKRLLDPEAATHFKSEVRDAWISYGHLLNQCTVVAFDQVCKWDEEHGLAFRHHSERVKARRLAKLDGRVDWTQCPYSTPHTIEIWLTRRFYKTPTHPSPLNLSPASAAQHGYVYVLSNQGMPGLLKIGYTDRSPKLRAAELFSTGHAHAFVIEAWWLIAGDARHAEAIVHKQLEGFRASSDREFFRLDPGNALREIEMSIRELKIIDRS